MDLRQYKQKIGFVRYHFFVILILVLTFYGGYRFAEFDNERMREKVDTLNKSMINLKNEHQYLESQLNILKVDLEISQLANNQSQLSLQEGREREQALKEQISFYQRVMAPEVTQDGFVLEAMEVIPTASDNNYSMQMILLQKKNIKAVIKGELVIQVFGSQDGNAANLNLTDIQDEPKTSLAFSFKYFQLLDLTFTLPEGFVAERFEIKTDIYRYRKKRGSYSTSLAWQEVFTQSQSESLILD